MADKIYDRPLKAVNELPADPDRSGLPWWRPILLWPDSFAGIHV
jgi:hypothetical protein